jgi:hypothetical protein
MAYTVRTIFLQNYFAPAKKLAEQRRGGNEMRDIVSAMKQTDMANKTLEDELNVFEEKGFNIVSVIPHPMQDDNATDLLMTVILEGKPDSDNGG